MATTFEDWQAAYPSLANLNFGKNSMVGGADLYGLSALNQPSGMQSLPATDYSAGGAGFATNGNVSGVAGAGNGLGWNLNTAQLGLGALQSLAGLYQGFQANKLARDQFRFTKDFATTNLNNSVQSYNTALADRANARAKVQGDSEAERDAYIASNRLSGR